MFATELLMRIDLATGATALINAGHPPPTGCAKAVSRYCERIPTLRSASSTTQGIASILCDWSPATASLLGDLLGGVGPVRVGVAGGAVSGDGG